jgi:endo-1,4-beta-xylanase
MAFARARTLLAFAVVGLVGAGAAGAGVMVANAQESTRQAVKAAAATGPALRTLADARGLRIGSAVSEGALRQEPAYRERLAAEFSSLTAENAMKWSRIEPRRGEYSFADADALVAFAKENNQTVRGHTLVWHHSLPAWLTTGDFTATELRSILKNHIELMVKRWSGTVTAWDVVNEAVDSSGKLRQTFWLERLGPGYVADAFRWARAADPRAKLYINDFSTEYAYAKTDGLHALVKDLRGRGVPVDGVGFQTHMTTDQPLASYQATLQRFAALGVDVAVTELDVRMRLPADAAKLAVQAQIYGRAMAACLAVARCVSFSTWGFTDAHSWIPFEGWGAATLTDVQMLPKPAYNTVRDLLAERDFAGRAVDVRSSLCLTGPTTGQLRVTTCSGTAAQQRFTFTRVENATSMTYRLTDNLGRCAAVSGTAVLAKACVAGDLAQRYQLIIPSAGGGDRRYKMMTMASAGAAERTCVQVKDNARTSGSLVVHDVCRTLATLPHNQVWHLADISGHP